MPLRWETHATSLSGWRPVGHPEVNLPLLKASLPTLARIPSIGDSFHTEETESIRAAQQRIDSGAAIQGDYPCVIHHARGLRQRRRIRALVLSAYASGWTDELAISIGDLFCIDLDRSGLPQSCVRFEQTYLELLEYAACSERGGTGEGSAAAEAAFDLGAHWYRRRRDERAVFWWHRAYELRNWEGACALGMCYEKGRGVAADPLQAARWYMKIQEMPEALSLRWFSDDEVPVDALRGWVRNGELLAKLANALPAAKLPELLQLVGSAFDRLVVSTPSGYVGVDQAIDAGDPSTPSSILRPPPVH